MADTVLGFDSGGNTIYRRDDGTFYSRDPFGGQGQLEVLGPGQTATPHADSSYDFFGGLLTGYTPQAFGPLISTTSPDAGSAYLNNRLQILNALGDATPGVAQPYGLSPTADKINALAEQRGNDGLLNLLEEIKAAGNLDALTAQINKETDAYRQARYATGDPFGQKGKNRHGGGGGLGGVAGAFFNPGLAAFNTAANVIGGLSTSDALPRPVLNYREDGQRFYNYEQSLAHSKDPAFQQFIQDSLSKDRALLDSLGISKESFVPNTFDLGSLGSSLGSFGGYGGTSGLGSFDYGGYGGGAGSGFDVSSLFGNSSTAPDLSSYFGGGTGTGGLGFVQQYPSTSGGGGILGGLGDILSGIYSGGGVIPGGNSGVLGDIGGVLSGLGSSILGGLFGGGSSGGSTSGGGGLLGSILGALGGGGSTTGTAGTSSGGGLSSLLPFLLLGGALGGLFNNDTQQKTRAAPPSQPETDLSGILQELGRQNLATAQQQYQNQQPQNQYLTRLFQDQNLQQEAGDALLSPQRRAQIDASRRSTIDQLGGYENPFNAGLLADFQSQGRATPDQLANIQGAADAATQKGLSDLARFRDEGLNQAMLNSAQRGLRPSDTPIQNDFANVQNEANRQAQNFVSGIRQNQFLQNLQFPLQAQQLRLGQFQNFTDQTARRRELEEMLAKTAEQQRIGLAGGAAQSGLGLLNSFNPVSGLGALTNVRTGNSTTTASPGSLDTISRIFAGLGNLATGIR